LGGSIQEKAENMSYARDKIHHGVTLELLEFAA